MFANRSKTQMQTGILDFFFWPSTSPLNWFPVPRVNLHGSDLELGGGVDDLRVAGRVAVVAHPVLPAVGATEGLAKVMGFFFFWILIIMLDPRKVYLRSRNSGNAGRGNLLHDPGLLL